MPRHLLDLSVISFMLGIGLYELSGWHFFMTYKSYQDGSSNEEVEDESLDVAAPPPPLEDLDYRNVFIVFIITLGLCLAYWFKILEHVSRESAKKNREFGTSSFGRAEASALNYLPIQLREVHCKFRSEPQVVPDSDEPEVVTVLKELSRDLKDRDEQWRQILRRRSDSLQTSHAERRRPGDKVIAKGLPGLSDEQPS